MTNLCLHFRLNILAKDYSRHYLGHTRDVLARSVDGMILTFSAEHLRPFIEHSGIKGLFEIVFDSKHKFQRLRKLPTP